MSHSTTAIVLAKNEFVCGSVLLARKYVESVMVVNNGCKISEIAEIVHLAGADIVNTLETAIEVITKNGTDIIIIINNMGNKYTDIIPKSIDHIKNNDFDIVVNSYKDIHNEDIGFIAFPIKSVNKIIGRIQFDNLQNILFQAEKNNLKIKYINFEPNPNQFQGYNIGVVVPAYNEELLIEETIKNIPKYVKKIYVIDDGSTDSTYNIIKNITDPNVASIRHDKNRGVGAAIITGYKRSLEDDMDIVVVMAGDDQMDPGQLPHLVKPIIENKADYTKGNRLISKDFRRGMSKWRTFGNAMLTMITKIGSGYWHIVDPQNGYTAISRQALETLDLDSIYHYYGYCNDMLIKLNAFGMRVEDVLIPARYGNERSKIKYSKYIIKVALMIFKGFLWRLKTKYMILDFHPLVFFYLSGMLLFPSGGMFSLWILYQKLYHNPVSPNYPLLAAFLTLMGLQLLLFAMFFDMQANKDRRQFYCSK